MINNNISSRSQKTAKNAIFLYARMMVVLLINLYSVRLILSALGMEDYGIFNVVAGVVTSLQFATSVLSASTQRFYSYTIGNNNNNRLNNIFSISINIYLVLSFSIFFLCETVGLWLLNTQLVIPNDKMLAANCIFQFSILSFIITILQIPYSSAVIAHEDMNIYAILSILDGVLKLFIAMLLGAIEDNRLIYYGFFLLVISLLICLSYVFICRKKYKECYHKKVTEKYLYKEILSFSGWSLFGSVAGVGMNQVCTILTNIFFGAAVNASRAIAFQISNALSALSSNFFMAIRPPMVKAFSGDSHEYLYKLFIVSNKFIYYSMLIVLLPFLFEMDSIIFLWLNSTSADTILFSRLLLIYSIIMALNNPISIIIQAIGSVKQYHLSVEIFTLLCMPATFLLFHLGYPAYSTICSMIVAAVLSHVVRIICLKKYFKYFKIRDYLIFLFQATGITGIAFGCIYIIHNSVLNSLSRFIYVTITSITLISFLSYLFVLSKEERLALRNIIQKKNRL